MCTAALVSKVTWGDPRAGGDSSSVQSNLRFVVQVQATQTAFAALLYDGSVVTWGQQRHGGDSSVVQDELKNVQQIQARALGLCSVAGTHVRKPGGRMTAVTQAH